MPWGALVPFLGIAFVVLTDLPMSALLTDAHLLDANEEPLGFAGLVSFLLLPFAALGLAVIAWTLFVERRPLSSIGLAAPHRVRTFALGQLTGVAMATAIVVGAWAAGGFEAGAIGPAFASPAALGSIALLLGSFALQSSVEELLFRGWMLSAIGAKFGVVWGVILSTAVFVLLHFGRHAGPVFAINVGLFAVFACSWALTTRNIFGAMGWHAGWNWILSSGFELRVTGLDAHQPALFIAMTPRGADYLTGGAEGPEGSIFCTFVLLLGIGYFVVRAARKRTQPA